MIRDTSLDVSPSSLPLVGNANSAVLEIEGTPISGMALRLNVGANMASTVPTLQVFIRASTSTAPTTDDQVVGQSEVISCPASAAAFTGEYIIPFSTPKRSVLVEYVVTGAATDSPSYSSVEAYIVENVGATWSRLTNFHA